MNNTNNIVSLTDQVNANTEAAIVEALSDRGGNWVGEFMLYNAADRVATPNVNVGELIRNMVRDDKLEKSFQAVQDKFSTTYQLPLYRLKPCGF